MEEYRPTVGQIITTFRFEYFPPPPETPILQSARFTAALWYQNLCFPHCACTAYGMRRKRRNPRQTPSSHTAASIVEPCFGSAVLEKQRKLFRVPINSATIAILGSCKTRRRRRRRRRRRAFKTCRRKQRLVEFRLHPVRSCPPTDVEVSKPLYLLGASRGDALPQPLLPLLLSRRAGRPPVFRAKLQPAPRNHEPSTVAAAVRLVAPTFTPPRIFKRAFAFCRVALAAARARSTRDVRATCTAPMLLPARSCLLKLLIVGLCGVAKCAFALR